MRFSPSPPPSSSHCEGIRSDPQGESVEELHHRDAKDSEWSLPTSMPRSQHTQEKELGRGKSVRGYQPFDKGEWGEMESLLKNIRAHRAGHEHMNALSRTQRTFTICLKLFIIVSFSRSLCWFSFTLHSKCRISAYLGVGTSLAVSTTDSDTGNATDLRCKDPYTPGSPCVPCEVRNPFSMHLHR